MKLINWINKVTKLNQSTMTEFQNNIENGKQDKIVEGTWTPILDTLEGKTPTVTYTTQIGTYKKIGTLVYIDFYIRAKITKLNGTENYGIISGLPFEVNASKYLCQQPITLGSLYQLLENEINANLIITNNKKIRIQVDYGMTAGKLKVTPTEGVGYCQISGFGWYETNN